MERFRQEVIACTADACAGVLLARESLAVIESAMTAALGIPDPVRFELSDSLQAESGLEKPFWDTIIKTISPRPLSGQRSRLEKTRNCEKRLTK